MFGCVHLNFTALFQKFPKKEIKKCVVNESRGSYQSWNVDQLCAFFFSCSFIMLMTCFIHVRE